MKYQKKINIFLKNNKKKDYNSLVQYILKKKQTNIKVEKKSINYSFYVIY